MSGAPSRAEFRASTVGADTVLPVSMAALLDSRRCVATNPPLSCSVGSNSGSIPLWSAGPVSPAVKSLSRLLPSEVTARLALTPDVLYSTEFLRTTSARPPCRKMPSPDAASLNAIVTLVAVTDLLVQSPPPLPVAIFPLSVTLVSDILAPLPACSIPPPSLPAVLPLIVTRLNVTLPPSL